MIGEGDCGEIGGMKIGRGNRRSLVITRGRSGYHATMVGKNSADAANLIPNIEHLTNY
jgi:hypothetical protein